MSAKKTDKDKDFGLPKKTKFKPINRTRITPKNKSSSNKTLKAIVFSLITLMLLSIGIGMFFWMKNKNIEEDEIEETEQEDSSSIFDEKEEEKLEEENLDQNEEETTKEEDIVSEEILIEEPAKPIIGNITFITEPENSYFVILSSSIDVDLAKDYAKKLVKEGNVMILYPPKDGLYHRVSIAKADTMEEANKIKNELKTKYGNDIWVMKY